MSNSAEEALSVVIEEVSTPLVGLVESFWLVLPESCIEGDPTDPVIEKVMLSVPGADGPGSSSTISKLYKANGLKIRVSKLTLTFAQKKFNPSLSSASPVMCSVFLLVLG